MEFLTQYDQMLLVEIAKNGSSITKKEQKTFDCKFYKSVSKLLDLGLIDCMLDKKDKRKKIYFLKDSGKFFAMIILGNEERKDYAIYFFSKNLFDVVDKGNYVNDNKQKESVLLSKE